MDLLSSLGLGDVLPEQSTRLTSLRSVAKDLESGADVRLGFNACLHCAMGLTVDLVDGECRDDVGVSASSKKTQLNLSCKRLSNADAITCQGCHRVKYCSTACRKADSEEQDAAGEPFTYGHSPVICALLDICNDDDLAEEEYFNKLAGKRSIKRTTEQNNNDDKPPAAGQKNKEKEEAARYRFQTELESYPATLFNILSEGTGWFVDAMTRRLRNGEQRGKRNRTPSGEQEERSELLLHIVGASVDSELWGWDGKTSAHEKWGRNDVPAVLIAYAEASANLATYLNEFLDIASVSIRCVFVGPDCPSFSPCRAEAPIPESRSAKLIFETHCCNYSELKQSHPFPSPDAIVFFNPGFSCMDYDWTKALTAAAEHPTSSSSSPASTPFLITTNTEMEGFADVQYLLDGGYIDVRSLPDDVLVALDHPGETAATRGDSNENGFRGSNHRDMEDSEGSDREEKDKLSPANFFFGMNPYSGLRVRQSGTMGNDLYVKNRWVVGGLFRGRSSAGCCNFGGSGGVVTSSPKKKRKKYKERRRSKEKRRDDTITSGDDRNTKKKNPALI